MIYVNGEWLSAPEALDQLGDLSKHSHKKFTVKCDSNISDKCRIQYSIEYRRYLRVLGKNENTIRCIYCSKTVKFTGRGNPNTKYIFDDTYFKYINTPEKAYLLGWIASDGSINRGSVCVAIHERDVEILRLFQQFICKDIPIRFFKTPTSKLCSYTISSTTMSKDICRHLEIKPKKKSDVIKFPKLSKELVWLFIRGYFEGDGTINDPFISKKKYPAGGFTSGSSDMLISLKDICGGYICKNSNNCNSLDISGKKMMKFLSCVYREDKNLILTRKYNRYLNWLSYDPHWDYL